VVARCMQLKSQDEHGQNLWVQELQNVQDL